MAAGFATVKAVLTGDTLVLMGRAVNGPPPELQISLSGVQAPRLARGPNGTDEPCAWEAREFLRKLCLGKTVQFRQDPNTKGGRLYGTIWLPSSAAAGGPPISVAEEVLRGGWCSVNGRTNEEVSTELIAAETEAKEARRGAHALDASARARCVRQVKWNADALTYANKYKDKPAKAIVEYVKDGSNMRCMILPDFAVINISLAGVRCGRVAKVAPVEAKEGVTPPPAPPAIKSEPYAEEARFFVEARLLHREVELKFAQIDRYGNAMCIVQHTAGLIAKELLKEGLGKISEPGLATGIEPAEAAAMREAEKLAKKQQKRLWRGYEPPQISGIEKEFDAHVVEVLSGDQLALVRSGSEDALTNEIRIQLSSIRAPRLGNPRADRASEPWAEEARECLRSVSIGKRCRVRVEYVKDMAEIAQHHEQQEGKTSEIKTSPQLKIFANVTLSSGVNRQGASRRDLAEIILVEGFASTVQPRTTEERAERFDFLLAAEKEARTKKLGLHSNKAPPPPAKIQDLMGDAKKARAFLPNLQRHKSQKAFVEVIFSGSRFKLRFPTENCSLVFALSACRAPSASSAARSAEVGGDEARAFARRYLNQRILDVSVTDMDRNGVGLGSIHVPSPEGDFESRLLQRGLARLDRWRADQQVPGTELGNKYKKWAQLEIQAKNNKLGLWSDETNIAEFEQQQQEKADRALATSGFDQNAKEVRRWRAKVADITDGNTCYLHDLDAKTARGLPLLDAIATKMRSLPTQTEKCALLKKNLIVAAQFQGEWCRAKIIEADKAKTIFKLRYLDYGNVESNVPASKLRVIDAEIASLPAAAIEASLAYIAVLPIDDEIGEIAAATLHELIWDKTLIVEQHADFYHGSDKANAKRVVLKLSDDPDSSINEKLVAAGLARVPRTAKRDANKTVDAPQYLEKLKDLEAKARAARQNLWRYGDVDYSENED